MIPKKLCFGFWFVLLLVCSSGLKDSDGQITTGEQKRDDVDWSLLQFSTERSIEKVSVELVDMKSSPWGKTGIAGKEGLTYKSVAVLDRKLLEIGLDLPLRLAVPKDRGFGAAGSPYLVGTVKITTNRDEFVIGITYSGFVLGSEEYQVQKVFFSWALAKYVDERIFEANGTHIPVEIFEALSGKSKIDKSKKLYKLTLTKELPK